MTASATADRARREHRALSGRLRPSTSPVPGEVVAAASRHARTIGARKLRRVSGGSCATLSRYGRGDCALRRRGEGAAASGAHRNLKYDLVTSRIVLMG